MAGEARAFRWTRNCSIQRVTRIPLRYRAVSKNFREFRLAVSRVNPVRSLPDFRVAVANLIPRRTSATRASLDALSRIAPERPLFPSFVQFPAGLRFQFS